MRIMARPAVQSHTLAGSVENLTLLLETTAHREAHRSKTHETLIARLQLVCGEVVGAAVTFAASIDRTQGIPIACLSRLCLSRWRLSSQLSGRVRERVRMTTLTRNPRYESTQMELPGWLRHDRAMATEALASGGRIKSQAD